jgi:hypothetical protein
MSKQAFPRIVVAAWIALAMGASCRSGAERPAAEGSAVRAGTLHVLSFGLGSPLAGPPADDLYGRDAVFVAEAFKRPPHVWSRVEATALSGLACTPERLRAELERLRRTATARDLVIVHASTHGTTQKRLLRLEGDNDAGPVIDADALAASLDALPCPSLVSIDACEAGGAVHSRLPPRSAWLLGCLETQSTSGQYDDPKVPHGFQVLALLEALRGDADADRDGLVSIGEMFAWVPGRATALARFSCLQDSVAVLPPDLAALPLTRAGPGGQKPLWEKRRVPSRNPWGLPDPPALREGEMPASDLFRRLKARAAVAEEAWKGCEHIAAPPGKGLAGTWASRWGKTPAEQLKNQGRAEIAETEQAFHAVIEDAGGCYLIEAARDPADPARLIGRWNSVGATRPSSRWEGRIVDSKRIDGQTSDGAWDFRR